MKTIAAILTMLLLVVAASADEAEEQIDEQIVDEQVVDVEDLPIVDQTDYGAWRLIMTAEPGSVYLKNVGNVWKDVGLLQVKTEAGEVLAQTDFIKILREGGNEIALPIPIGISGRLNLVDAITGELITSTYL